MYSCTYYTTPIEERGQNISNTPNAICNYSSWGYLHTNVAEQRSTISLLTAAKRLLSHASFLSQQGLLNRRSIKQIGKDGRKNVDHVRSDSGSVHLAESLLVTAASEEAGGICCTDTRPKLIHNIFPAYNTQRIIATLGHFLAAVLCTNELSAQTCLKYVTCLQLVECFYAPNKRRRPLCQPTGHPDPHNDDNCLRQNTSQLHNMHK